MRQIAGPTFALTMSDFTEYLASALRSTGFAPAYFEGYSNSLPIASLAFL